MFKFQNLRFNFFVVSILQVLCNSLPLVANAEQAKIEKKVLTTEMKQRLVQVCIKKAAISKNKEKLSEVCDNKSVIHCLVSDKSDFRKIVAIESIRTSDMVRIGRLQSKVDAFEDSLLSTRRHHSEQFLFSQLGVGPSQGSAEGSSNKTSHDSSQGPLPEVECVQVRDL